MPHPSSCSAKPQQPATSSGCPCCRLYEPFKRLFDICLALVGILAFSWLLLPIAILVRCGSKGPIFYRGVRTGRYGKPFRIFKFRTMVVDAEQCGGTTTGKDDPRITPIGHFLRKCKLDELPQLFNVLFGDMSFVGPRPEVAEYTDAYTEEERAILSVRPGITDFSSIEFHDLQAVVGSEDPDATFRAVVLPRKIALRLKYVEMQSFWVDMMILFQTVWIVVKKPWQRRSS